MKNVACEILALLLFISSSYALSLKEKVAGQCNNAVYGFDRCENISNKQKSIEGVAYNMNTYWRNWKEVADYVNSCGCWVTENQRYANYYNGIKKEVEKYNEAVAEQKESDEKKKKIAPDVLRLCEKLEKETEFNSENRYRTLIQDCANNGRGYNCKEYMQNVNVYLQKCKEYGETENFKNRIFTDAAKIMEKIKQDSIEKANLAAALATEIKEAADEIKSLIESKAETNLILKKCERHPSITECLSFKALINQQKIIDNITALLKANKLEECIMECRKLGGASDLCDKQLVDKVKKLPLKKINPELSEIYFSPFYGLEFIYEGKKVPKNSNVYIVGEVRQNDGKKAFFGDFIVKHSGQCLLRERQMFSGYAKYLGEEVFRNRTLPTFQLVWCEEN